MNLRRGFFVGLSLIPLAQRACARTSDGGGLPSARRDVFTRFAEDDVVSDVGLRHMHPMGPGEEHIEQALVDSLEADAHTSGEAPEASLLCSL